MDDDGEPSHSLTVLLTCCQLLDSLLDAYTIPPRNPSPQHSPLLPLLLPVLILRQLPRRAGGFSPECCGPPGRPLSLCGCGQRADWLARIAGRVGQRRGGVGPDNNCPCVVFGLGFVWRWILTTHYVACGGPSFGRSWILPGAEPAWAGHSIVGMTHLMTMPGRRCCLVGLESWHSAVICMSALGCGIHAGSYVVWHPRWRLLPTVASRLAPITFCDNANGMGTKEGQLMHGLRSDATLALCFSHGDWSHFPSQNLMLMETICGSNVCGLLS